MELDRNYDNEIYKAICYGEELMPYAPMFNFGSVRFGGVGGGSDISLDLGAGGKIKFDPEVGGQVLLQITAGFHKKVNRVYEQPTTIFL